MDKGNQVHGTVSLMDAIQRIQKMAYGKVENTNSPL